MSYKIAIPSIYRSKTIVNKTLNYLSKTDVDLKKVDVFLSDPEEKKDYEKTTKKFGVNIITTGKKHVNTQRNFIVDYYPEGTNIVGIDDDIVAIVEKINDKSTKLLIKLHSFIEEAFRNTKSQGAKIWGINPVNNPYFLKKNVSNNLKYIVACFYGWINSHQQYAYVSTNPEYGKEDFERSIRYYIEDKKVIRFNYLAPDTKYYSESGGIQHYRTVEYEEKAVQWLLKTFPLYCKRKTTKGKFPEVRLHDQTKNLPKLKI
tara:strand:- start:1316 stop:2095 length:780 start_codon:yes stop_codon:yes gene_type:complete